MNPSDPFSGRTRKRGSSRLVKLTDLLARLLITVGGIGTILAVTGVCVFLIWVVLPLFQGASVSGPRQLTEGVAGLREQPVREGVDEHLTMGWGLFQDGSLATFRLDNGRLLDRFGPRGLYRGADLSAWSAPDHGPDLALGFADGTVQLSHVGFKSRLLEEKEITAELRALKPGKVLVWNTSPEQKRRGDPGAGASGLCQALPNGQYRLKTLSVAFDDPIKPASPSPVRKIDLTPEPSPEGVSCPTFIVASLTADGILRTRSVARRHGAAASKSGELKLPDPMGPGSAGWLLLSGEGDNAYLLGESGRLLRIDTREVEEPRILEELDLLSDSPKIQVTAAQFLIGRETLLVGDSTGRIRAWFRARSREGRAPDKHTLVAAHTFAGHGVAVTALAASAQSRLVAAGYADGRVRLLHVTSEQQLAEVRTEPGVPVRRVLFPPRDNALLAQAGTGCWLWQVKPGYPEVTLRTLFRPIWYEGYDRPEHVWQSTGGAGAEPKYGFWPLVFGTLKATFYSLLLGVPLALLAAIYTSEFLHPRTRAVVKPAIEMMASLPSVVLGFLAGLILAPFVDRLLPAVLAGFLTLPGCFLLGAYLWQLLPEKWTLRLQRFHFGFLCLVLPLGVLAAPALGWLVEWLLFAGDLKGWLNNRSRGSALPGWFLLLLPVATLLVLFLAELGAQFRAAALDPRLGPAGRGQR